MKHLWAPWRMEYILGKEEEGCFLCRILAAEADRENLVLKRTTKCAIVINRYPYNSGHLMVCVCRHVGEIGALDADERLETINLVAEAIEALQATIHPEGFNVGINLGRAGGAGLEEHLHTHIVPRWSGDTNFMPVMADVRVVPQSLLELWDRLQPVFNP